ncbi:hypothetical protein LguiA_018525 [Lonicera macranthoides]
MELFKNAKSIRLRSHHSKYLIADPDKESVFQDRSGSTRNAKWTVEIVDHTPNLVRLKSHHGKYLTASEEQHLLGVTGRKVLQSLPKRLDSSVEWEPIREGKLVRLKTRYGNYLRANAGIPPWRNSITHDIPQRHSGWVLWEVDVIEKRPEEETKRSFSSPASSEDLDLDLSSGTFNLRSSEMALSRQSSESSSSSSRSDGRLIYYNVADYKGRVLEGNSKGRSFHFKGLDLEELTSKLEEETGMDNITVCQRNSVNGKLCPLRLALPPNNASMHVVVVPSNNDD